MKKPIVASLTAIACAMSAVSCNGNDNEKSSSEEKDEPKTNYSQYMKDYARTEFNDSLDLSDFDFQSNDIPADFALTLEAEEGTLSGETEIPSISLEGYSGDGYVFMKQSEGDSLTFSAQIETAGNYDLIFNTASSGGQKYNNVSVNGNKVGDVYTQDGTFSLSTVKQVYLEKGKNDIMITPSWGWIYIDNVKIVPASSISEDTYKVSSELVNPNAGIPAKQLMKFMADVYGKYIISGQYASEGVSSAEIEKIEKQSGKKPAILGLDLIEYSPSRVEHDSSSQAIEHAIDWYYNYGGIVTFCWHWNAPSKYLINTSAQPWYKGFYKEATTINLDDIMNGKDNEGYDLLMSDIDAIALQLKRLDDAGVPVLWRPLHEASGGWFWWGNCSAESYKKLWNAVYDKLTNEHKLTNLIWVWNGQNKDWYPGDETVDMIGEDLYPGEKVYSSQSSKFMEVTEYTDTKKIIAMSENGCLFDPELAIRDGSLWSWFCVWNGEFVVDKFRQLNGIYNEKEMWSKVYQHERVLTLDELPDLRKYKID